MLSMGGPQELFPVCTVQEYHVAEQEYRQLVQNQIVHQRLEQFEMLSIELTTEMIEALKG